VKACSMARVVKKPEERRADIVNAARMLFLTKEYDKATMQDVMHVLNIAKGTIYHYFKSKEELLAAVVKDMVDKYVEAMQNRLQNLEANALTKIQILITAGRNVKDNQPILEQLHKPGNEALHLRLLAELIAKLAPLYASAIRQGCEEGIFKTDAPLECAEFILSAFQFLTDPGIYPWLEKDLLRRMEAFPGIVEQMLNAPGGSFHFLNL